MRPSATWAIIPVKAPADAKRRLSPVLSSEQRRQLVLTMLDDVLGTVCAVESIDIVLVVTPDAQVAALAEAKGAFVLREERATGLNAAVERGLQHARRHGAASGLVLPADIPLATVDELRGVAAASAASVGGRVILVPSTDGQGTNALGLAPPDALAPSFGPDSFVRHLAHAVARRLDTRVLQLPGIGADIDEPRDLTILLQRSQGSMRYSFLEPRAQQASRPPRPDPGACEP